MRSGEMDEMPCISSSEAVCIEILAISHLMSIFHKESQVVLRLYRALV